MFVSCLLLDNIQLLHLNEINMRFYGAEYNNIEWGEAEFNIVVLYSMTPHIDQVLLHMALFYSNFEPKSIPIFILYQGSLC
jgi:hypothetical protein